MSASCRFCDSEFCIKHGFIRKKQRYFCKECRRHFVLRPALRGYSAKIKIQALLLLKSGLGYRAVAQTLAISYTAVWNWRENPDLVARRIAEEAACEQGQDIDIVPMTELHQYSQTHAMKFDYGLLVLIPQERIFPAKIILAGPSRREFL